jgi:hypothetical protein
MKFHSLVGYTGAQQMEEARGSPDADEVAPSEMSGSSDWQKSPYEPVAARRGRSPSPLLCAMDVLALRVAGMPVPLGITSGACGLWALNMAFTGLDEHANTVQSYCLDHSMLWRNVAYRTC